jgi:hypothetical protein
MHKIASAYKGRHQVFARGIMPLLCKVLNKNMYFSNKKCAKLFEKI